MIVLWPHYYDREISLSTKEKRQIHRRAWKIWFERRSNVVLYAAVLVLLNAVLNAIPWILREIGGRDAYWHWPVSLVTYVILLFVAVILLQRYRFAPPVRRAVRELGYDLCLQCGYWMKGLDETIDRCPECGTHRTPPDAADAERGGDPSASTTPARNKKP